MPLEAAVEAAAALAVAAGALAAAPVGVGGSSEPSRTPADAELAEAAGEAPLAACAVGTPVGTWVAALAFPKVEAPAPCELASAAERAALDAPWTAGAEDLAPGAAGEEWAACEAEAV
jgi:hypothetical protein